MKRILITVLVLCTLAMIPGCRTYDDGYQAGKEFAYSDMEDKLDEYYDDGYKAGYEDGCEEGNSNGYNDGYADGLYDADWDELYWWRDHAVIVTTAGEKYHTYDCQYVRDREFYIYNVELAIGKGYTPCSVCIHALEYN